MAALTEQPTEQSEQSIHDQWEAEGKCYICGNEGDPLYVNQGHKFCEYCIRDLFYEADYD